MKSQNIFELRPVKSAKVSEISEATAASSVPTEERMNFHIGHPVQDKRLYQTFFKLATGLDPLDFHGNNETQQERIEAGGWSSKQIEELQFLQKTIRNSAPYLPRGGYNSKDPGPLIDIIKSWLSTGQTEPLTYDFGETATQRECMLATGGVKESLRVLFHALSAFLINLPAKILLYHVDLPAYLNEFPDLSFTSVTGEDQAVFDQILRIFNSKTPSPVFLILGKMTSESLRKNLRGLSLEKPLFFIEINQAENHESIAREAKMQNRVLRFLNACVLNRKFNNLAVEFILGNADFIKILETVQFEIKGTPSVTEIDLIAHLSGTLQQQSAENRIEVKDLIYEIGTDDPLQHKNLFDGHVSRMLTSLSHLTNKVQVLGQATARRLALLEKHQDRLLDRLQTFGRLNHENAGSLAEKNAAEIVALFYEHLEDEVWQSELSENFLDAFIKQHPEYKKNDLLAVSGSARTALSLLGFHCGISEVVTADLGWTYEHCFPEVTAVPLTSQLNLDSRALRDTLEKKIASQPGWKDFGAVVLNNPHNASGYVATEKDLRELIQYLLENRIFLIDDLSYQNVLPLASLSGPKTLKQIVRELIRDGYLSTDRLRYLITVHSLSKTDCFAGARLAVVDIPDPVKGKQFRLLVSNIKPNLMALLLSYLFYRNDRQVVNSYWLLRNRIFAERMSALEKAAAELPVDRNPYRLQLQCPQGSMYPRLDIQKLPNGLSLDWLSSNLANSGIGLIPLSTFAKTAHGFELARKSFRMTLGGSDGPDQLKRKTRRLLISLNRLVANEEARYNLKTIRKKSSHHLTYLPIPTFSTLWPGFARDVLESARISFNRYLKKLAIPSDNRSDPQSFMNAFLPFRLSILQTQIKDKLQETEEILEITRSKNRNRLLTTLADEFYKDNLNSRAERFRRRLFDRTVHPTQMYALKVDITFEQIIRNYLITGTIDPVTVRQISDLLTAEYFGLNIPISSSDEADELVCDLHSLTAAEKYIYSNSEESIQPILSFWGDWDGSNRPSGQGHRLVASALLDNVSQMASLITLLKKKSPGINIDSLLQRDLHSLELNKKKFWELLNKITRLTNQLEKRYRRFIPLELSYGKIKKLALRLHLSRDPLAALWQHNDRLEKKMLHMRMQRKASLAYYFSLNKRLRKFLHDLIPIVENLLDDQETALAFGQYRDSLRRFVLTPRIHQRIITSDDPFTIDTTVHNIMEINEISGNYGNPGMVMALQVSMATEPEALIVLDRKLRARRDEILRENPSAVLPPVWIIPLFEDTQSIGKITDYLDILWSYANQSRKIDQTREERFTEMICEVFVAGSDLSQEVGQAAAASLYAGAKASTMNWLAARGLVKDVRMKFGSGEAMQRQGGFYDLDSERPLFIKSEENKKRMSQDLKASTQKSTEFAKSPLRGVLSSGDLRTFQSAISEKLRFLPVAERANLFYHLSKAQMYHDKELARISEPLLETRLQFKIRGYQEIEAFIRGNTSSIYDDFLYINTANFRQILYGKEEDVVGIHIISHFISRALPELRDRPTVRPSREMGKARGQQIIERVAQTLPLCKHGSMLRAIGHNRGQTMVLGINQLTTGLFRSLNEFSGRQEANNDSLSRISNQILPQLPVQEILQTLFYFHDPTLQYVREMERAFPAGNSSFLFIQEDLDSIPPFIHLFQKEYLRRFGLDINDFFKGNIFNPNLLPVIRPEIAVLMQKDIFNTNPDQFFAPIGGSIDSQWREHVEQLLNFPVQIKEWRKQIWEHIRAPIYDQVESFVKLALAINTISNVSRQGQQAGSTDISEVLRLGGQVAKLLQSTGDDSMRQFLTDVVQLLTQIPATMTEIPVDIIRALRDVERIVKIEEQVLSSHQQNLVRFYFLQIARLSGDNG